MLFVKMEASAGAWKYFAVVALHALCSGDNVMGEGTESKDQTALTDGPEFESTVQKVTVLTGSTALLNCTVLNLQHYKVAWLHNDSKRILTVDRLVITRDPRVSLFPIEGPTYMLVIKDAQPEDSGAYLCQINTHPMKAMTFVVDVADGVATPATPGSDIQDASNEKLEVTEVLPTTTVLAGHTASLRCNLNPFDGDEIAWVNEDTGKVLSVGAIRITNESRVSVRRQTNESVRLLIKNVRLEDSGAYACHLQSDPIKALRFMLRVIDEPAVSSTSMKLTTKQSQLVVTLQCTLHAVPHPLLYWSKDGHTFNATGKNHEATYTRRVYGEVSMSLTLRNVGVDEAGIYRCHAENSVGRRSARFVMSKDIINSVVSMPAEELGPTQMPDTKENVGKQTEDSEALTTSPNLDSGDSNASPKLITPVKNITAKLGQTVSLNCPVKILEPYQIMWRRFQGRQVISVGSYIIARSQRYSVVHDAEGIHKLVIKDVQYDDSDIYSCLLTSHHMPQLEIFLDVVRM